MRKSLPLFLTLITYSQATFFDNFFSQKNTTQPIYYKKKFMGNIAQTSLDNNAILYKMYSAENKHLGNLIIHETYISQEHDKHTKKENKCFQILVKKIHAQHSIIFKNKNHKKHGTSSKYKNLHDGETLADYMDFWIKKN